jgi:hypothetical protein
MQTESKRAPVSATRAPLRKSAQTELTILKLTKARPWISSVELAKEARLSTAAITGVVNAFSERGLLVD